MSQNSSTIKRVSFIDKKKPNNNINDFSKSDTKRGSILKHKGKELKNDKVIEVIQKDKKEDIDNLILKLNDKNEEDPIIINDNSNNKNKYLSTDEYFKATIQKDLEQGLLNLALLHPADPIKFLGNFLIEKSKNNSSTL